MKKLMFALAAVAVVGAAQAEIDTRPILTREQARVEAKSLARLMDEASGDLQTAIETGDEVGLVKYVTRPLSTTIQRWHERQHPNDLESCAVAADLLHSYAMNIDSEYFGFGQGATVALRKERARYLADYKKYRKECLAAIKAP